MIAVEYKKHPEGWQWVIHQNGKSKHHSEYYPKLNMAKKAANDVLKHLHEIAPIKVIGRK